VTDGQHIPQEDLALYAMHALTPAEDAVLQAHLHTCADCRQDLAEVNGDLGAIALSVDQQPLPAGARERFMARVEAEARPAAAEPPVAKASAGPVLVPTPRRSLVPVLLPWAAAIALLIFGGLMHRRTKDLQELLDRDKSQIAMLSAQASRAQQVMDTLTSPSAQHATLTEKPAAVPTGHATYVPERGALIFIAEHLKQVPGNKTYELWIIPANGSAPIPAGTFRPDANGTASVVLPPIPQGVPAKAFGVTIENEGGAQSPTMPIVLSGS
jgi:Anti-sigma-K factor rskA/Putative zinc-finger